MIFCIEIIYNITYYVYSRVRIAFHSRSHFTHRYWWNDYIIWQSILFYFYYPHNYLLCGLQTFKHFSHCVQEYCYSDIFECIMECNCLVCKQERIFWSNRASPPLYLVDVHCINSFMSYKLAAHHRLQFIFSINSWRCNGDKIQHHRRF